MAGTVAGAETAKRIPAAAAHVIVDPQGGKFCPVMKAYGWDDFHPTDEMVNHTPEHEAGILANTLDHVEKCK